MTHLLTSILIRRPMLMGIFGLLTVLLFGTLGVLSVQDLLSLPDAPSVVTTAGLAEALESQESYWASLQDPAWDCSTLQKESADEDADTEVFIRDPENSVAIEVTFTDPVDCADLDPAQVVGVARLMSEKHIRILQEEGRLASFQGYRTLAYLCTTCGRQNSGCLIGLSVVFVVIGLALSYPLVTSIRGEVAGRKEPRQPVRWQKHVPQYIPQVSREDVDRILARDYPAGRHAAIRQMIERSDQGRDPRILLACLKNAGGDFERLRKQLLDDSLDWRDIISQAEYPGYIRHLLTIDQLTEEQQRQIVEGDKAQYLEWLNRGRPSI